PLARDTRQCRAGHQSASHPRWTRCRFMLCYPRCDKKRNDHRGKLMTIKIARRAFLRLAAGASALPALPHVARAQAWPNRIVRIVVGFPPGGGADAISRIMAARFSEIWGQQSILHTNPAPPNHSPLPTLTNSPPAS